MRYKYVDIWEKEQKGIQRNMIERNIFKLMTDLNLKDH